MRLGVGRELDATVEGHEVVFVERRLHLLRVRAAGVLESLLEREAGGVPARRVIRRRRAELRLICGGEVGAGRSIEGHAGGLRSLGRVLRLGLPLRWADDELSGVTDVRKRRLGRRDEQRDETSADLL